MTAAAIAFAVLLLTGLPIGFGMVAAGLSGAVSFGGWSFLQILPDEFYTGVSGFVLIAIPYFIFTAELMNRSGLTGRLIAFSNSMFGRIPGALSHVNIMVSLLFAGITGAAVTDAVAIGKTLIPAMKKEGYGGDYSAAVTACASIVGPIVPPSIIMIVYATTMRNISVMALFAAGLVPGLLMAGFLLLTSAVVSWKRGYTSHEQVRVGRIIVTGFQALPAFGVPIVIIGGILSGITTVTEAAVLGAFLTLLLGVFVYRSLTWRAIWDSLVATVSFSGVVFLLLGAATLLGWYVTRSGLTASAANVILSISHSSTVEILVVDVFLVIMGMFIDVLPAVVVAGPVLVPAMEHLGFAPLHFAMVMLLALNIGNITPPVGMTLMTTTKIANVSYESAVRESLPFLISQLAVVVLVSLAPEIILWFPRMIGAG